MTEVGEGPGALPTVPTLKPLRLSAAPVLAAIPGTGEPLRTATCVRLAAARAAPLGARRRGLGLCLAFGFAGVSLRVGAGGGGAGDTAGAAEARPPLESSLSGASTNATSAAAMNSALTSATSSPRLPLAGAGAAAGGSALVLAGVLGNA